jgi:carboxylesterase
VHCESLQLHPSNTDEQETWMSDPTVMPGAEPFFFPGGPTGVLVCHGYTGTTQSMRPLGEHLAAAGHTVIGPRLAGHGTTPEDMALTTAGDWIASVDAALEDLKSRCTQVFMVGLSMGGLLTLYTAAKHAATLRGAVVINAPVRIGSPDLAGLALDPRMPAMIPGVGSDIKDPASKELAYAQLPVATLKQLYALTAVTRDLLPTVKCPTLVMQSREDHLVHPDNARRIVRELGADRVELLWLNHSYHVATLDHDRELVFERTAAFIASIAADAK